jgi:hypothetical protein
MKAIRYLCRGTVKKQIKVLKDIAPHMPPRDSFILLEM